MPSVYTLDSLCSYFPQTGERTAECKESGQPCAVPWTGRRGLREQWRAAEPGGEGWCLATHGGAACGRGRRRSGEKRGSGGEGWCALRARQDIVRGRRERDPDCGRGFQPRPDGRARSAHRPPSPDPRLPPLPTQAVAAGSRSHTRAAAHSGLYTVTRLPQPVTRNPPPVTCRAAQCRVAGTSGWPAAAKRRSTSTASNS